MEEPPQEDLEKDETARTNRGVRTALAAFFLSAVVGTVAFVGTAGALLESFRAEVRKAEEQARRESERRRRICTRLGISEDELLRREAAGEKFEGSGDDGR